MMGWELNAIYSIGFITCVAFVRPAQDVVVEENGSPTSWRKRSAGCRTKIGFTHAVMVPHQDARCPHALDSDCLFPGAWGCINTPCLGPDIDAGRDDLV